MAERTLCVLIITGIIAVLGLLWRTVHQADAVRDSMRASARLEGCEYVSRVFPYSGKELYYVDCTGKIEIRRATK